MHINKNYSVAIIGGDNRSACLASLFYDDGYKIKASALERCDLPLPVQVSDFREAIDSSEIIVLPMPVSRDGVTLNTPFAERPVHLKDIFSLCSPKKLLLGGKVSTVLPEILGEKSLKIVDYMQREELSVANSIPTAEGAIAIAMNELPITIYGSTALVIGYGRIGKILSKNLKDLGANTSVSARKQSDFAWIKAAGLTALSTERLSDFIGEFDVIFNTVPVKIINEDVIAHVSKKAVVIDLASAPGGVDFSAAKRLDIKTIQALSLPGKVAPLSAARIIKDTILNIITEELD